MALYIPQEIEKEILKFWEKNKIFEKLIQKNKGKKTFSFIDGPITANNPMGVHHAWGRTYKDLYNRFMAMQGHDLRFQNGFDCQGLWVEVEVEKELGLNSKKEIENMGLEKFSKKCRERVEKYSAIQTHQSILLGQWMDWKNSYYTMSDYNNQCVWYFLKKCYENRWLYKGTDVMPWCLRCGTSLSQHELFDSYRELSHTAVFMKYKIKGRENEFLLVWSTTPWTFPANVAIAVNPELDYVQVSQRVNIDGKEISEMYYLSEKTLKNLKGEYIVLDHLKGKKMVGLKYEGNFDYMPVMKGRKHKIIGWDLVGEEEGTGLVHIAPGCGKDDHELGKTEKLDVIAPIDENGNYYNGYGWLTGKSVKDVADLIIKDLEKNNRLYRTEVFTHRYPCCWRCNAELVFRLVNEWFIKTEPLRKKLIEVTKTIKWSPDYTMLRQVDWFRNMGDWCISRKRYWGLTLPFFECTCGHLEVIGNEKELREKALRGLEQLKELHRPWMDNVILKCPKCGSEMRRIQEVGDCWLDAGIVTFSTLNYLHDKKYWEKWFPADFITECAPGQYRGWFYSLLFMSTTLTGKAPFKSIIGHELVKDEKGDDMHKSKGNVIWFDDAVEKIGADVMRWMYASQNPANYLLFGYGPAKDVKKQLEIIFNLGNYVETYCKLNDFNPKKYKETKKDLESKWLLSRLENVKKNVTTCLDKLTPYIAMRELKEFLLNDFSRWYIHIVRDKLKKGYTGKDKEYILHIMYSTMLDSFKLMAPFLPFITEKLYQNFFREFEKTESIHLMDWPKSNEKIINNTIEKEMEIVKNIIETVNSERQDKKIKLRWSVSDVTIYAKKLEVKKAVQNFENVIKVMGNVKEIKFVKKTKHMREFNNGALSLGNVLKDESLVRELIRHVQTLRKKQGLHIQEKIILYLKTDASTEKILKKWENEILVGVNSKEMKLGKLEHSKGRMELWDKKIEIEFEKA